MIPALLAGAECMLTVTVGVLGDPESTSKHYSLCGLIVKSPETRVRIREEGRARARDGHPVCNLWFSEKRPGLGSCVREGTPPALFHPRRLPRLTSTSVLFTTDEYWGFSLLMSKSVPSLDGDRPCNPDKYKSAKFPLGYPTLSKQ